MITEQMTTEDQGVTEAGLTEVRQGEIMEVTRMNVPIIEPLIINIPMIIDLGRKTEWILGNRKMLEGNLIRQVIHSHLLKNYPKYRIVIVIYVKISLLKRRRTVKADQNRMHQMQPSPQ